MCGFLSSNDYGSDLTSRPSFFIRVTRNVELFSVENENFYETLPRQSSIYIPRTCTGNNVSDGTCIMAHHAKHASCHITCSETRCCEYFEWWNGVEMYLVVPKRGVVLVAVVSALRSHAGKCPRRH